MADTAKPIIRSLLDNDFYKLTMQHAVVQLFPRARVRYRFINRGQHRFPAGFGDALRAAVDAMRELRLQDAEKTFLQRQCPYLTPTYLDFLQGFRYDPAEVSIHQQDGDLTVGIEGYWYRTILWEVPLMSTICELYYRLSGMARLGDDEVCAIARKKILHYRDLGVKIAEFGTRRRHSYAVQRLVVQTLLENGAGTFTGTSNVHLAHTLGTRPIGTHAHEWFMFHAARYGFKMANALSLENWVNVYRGDLGIALSDTYTTRVFLDSFDTKFSKLFDGVRHDSGDPLDFAGAVIRHYRQMQIDPLSKTIIFSDGLNPDKVNRIAAYCRGKVGMSFGIGTDFTNDAGPAPLNIVIKLTEARPGTEEHWTRVVKLSDDREKYTGDPDMIDLAKTVLGIPKG